MPITFVDEVQPENFLPIIIASLKKPVMNFFTGERIHGKRRFVKDSDVFTERNIDRILNMDFMKGMDKVYEAVDQEYTPEDLRDLEKNGRIKHEIELMLTLLRRAARAGVPKIYAMGTIAVYVELVLGKHVADPDPESEEDNPAAA